MKRPGDKYRKKRDRVLILYLLTVLCAFLLAVATVEVEWLYGLFMVLVMVCAVGGLAFIPLVIWTLVQTMKARQEDRRFITLQERSSPVELTDVSGETVRYPRRPAPYPYAGREEKGPWWAVIGLMFLLPPLGVCFALYKLYQEPQNAFDNAVVARAAGWVFLVLSVLIGSGMVLLEAADGSQLVMLILLLPGLMAVCALAKSKP